MAGKSRAKSTMTSKSAKKTKDYEKFSDPCIPDVVCGLDLFYFILMALPIIGYILFFTAFLAPYWGKLSIEETGMSSIPKEFEMGIWQTCSYFPLEDDSFYHACTMVEHLPELLEAIMIYPQIVPQWEISTCRILYFIIFALAAAALYWPFFWLHNEVLRIYDVSCGSFD